MQNHLNKKSNVFFKLNYTQPNNRPTHSVIQNSSSGFTPVDQSPSSTFSLFLEPILNPYYQSYQNIITLDREPSGPIRSMVSMISMPKLSPFQSAAAYASPYYNGTNCAWVLLRYPAEILGGVGSGAFKNADSFMCADDIPAVFSYLMSNGYMIDTSLTKMMFQSRIEMGGVADRRLSGDRKLIAFVARNN